MLFVHVPFFFSLDTMECKTRVCINSINLNIHSKSVKIPSGIVFCMESNFRNSHSLRQSSGGISGAKHRSRNFSAR